MKTLHRFIMMICFLMLSLLLGHSSTVAASSNSLKIPSSVTVIEKEAFCGDTSLGEVVLPEGIKEIQARAFADSSLTSINLPDSLQSIANNAFDGPEKVSITANAGSTAFAWAAQNGYIEKPEDTHLSVRSVNNSITYVEPGETVLLEVEASCDVDILSYNWYQKSGRDPYFKLIEEANGPKLTTKEIYVCEEYCCLVRDIYGNHKSIYLTVTIDTNMNINTSYNQKIYVEDGEKATLSTSATSDREPITYQWHKLESTSGISNIFYPIEGATEPTFITEPIHGPIRYLCTAMDAIGNTISTDFTVTINTHLSLKPKDSIYTAKVKKGEKATLSVIANCDLSPLTYQWYKKDDDEYQPLAGATFSEYITGSINEKNDYACKVTDPIGNTEMCFISVIVDTNLSAHPLENLNNIKVNLGESATLTVVASCDVPVSYQWYDDYGKIKDAKQNSYTTKKIERRTNYQCYVTDIYGYSTMVNFNVGIDTHLKVQAANNTNYIEVNPGESVKLAVDVSCDVEVTYEWYEVDKNYNYIKIDGAIENNYTVESVNDIYKYICGVKDAYDNYESVFFNLRVKHDFTVRPAGGQTKFEVSPGETVTLAVEVDCDTPVRYVWNTWKEGYSELPEAKDSKYIIENVKETMDYICYVYDIYGNYEKVYFQVIINTNLTAQPLDNKSNFEINYGENVTFTVSASCDVDLKYQWHKVKGYDNIEIEGETNNSLTIQNASKSGVYRCRVSDDYGNYKYVDFRVKIKTNLTAHAANNETYIRVKYGDPVTLTVEASCDLPITYQWTKTENHVFETIPGATEASYSVNEISNNVDYRCEVMDSYENSLVILFCVRVDTNLTAQALDDKTDIEVNKGDSVTLTVQASCDVPVTYKWYIYDSSWNEIEGATEASYLVETVDQDTRYYCKVDDGLNNEEYIYFSVNIK